MKGAREYSKLFKTGQYGRFYITSGSHARGNTFHIQILPEGEEAIPNGEPNLCLNKDAVKVFGVTGGNRGWSEQYGWLHLGKWVDDFESLCDERREELRQQEVSTILKEEEAKKALMERTKQLLSRY